MDSKKRMYIIIIAVAAAVLIGLIIWAICLSVNRHADGTETTGNQLETTAQAAENTTAEPENDTTGEATTQPDDTAGETTDPTETTAEEGKKPSGSSGGSNSGSTPGSENNKPDNEPDDEPDDEPDNEPDNEPDDEPDNGNNSGGNNDKPTPTEPTFPDAYPYNVTYQEYLDMTEDEQIAFYKCFKNHNEFKQWRTAAKKEYEDNKIKIEIGSDGKIDLSPITGKN